MVHPAICQGVWAVLSKQIVWYIDILASMLLDGTTGLLFPSSRIWAKQERLKPHGFVWLLVFCILAKTKFISEWGALMVTLCRCSNERPGRQHHDLIFHSVT